MYQNGTDKNDCIAGCFEVGVLSASLIEALQVFL
jgi:hypothetical protein